jgi:hypothetical protein
MFEAIEIARKATCLQYTLVGSELIRTRGWRLGQRFESARRLSRLCNDKKGYLRFASSLLTTPLAQIRRMAYSSARVPEGDRQGLGCP